MSRPERARLLQFVATDRGDEVSALLVRPSDARWLLVLGHGAGAGMRHEFMEEMARLLGAHSVATLRYQFPYMEAGRRAPDTAKRLVETVRAAVDCANRVAEGLPVLVGGKSMGGRMASTAASQGELSDARGLVFFGFPLHPAGRPSLDRATHLQDVRRPMLFVQGTRDRLAELELIRAVCEGLGRRATLHVVQDGDHSFKVLKRTGRTVQEVREELAATVARWVERTVQDNAGKDADT